MPTDPSASLPSPAEIVEALAPIRMPADFAAFTWRDGLAAFSLGLFVAVLLSLVLRPLFHRVRDPLARIRADLADLSTRPFQERLLGQATLMTELEADPPLEPVYREALYRPIDGDTLDLDGLDGRILAAARQTKGQAKDRGNR
ncbi:MAG: hypothetical protein K9H25_06720 [Rhodospirillum sp.]|nr:hypothetical protein [Rhodospirillum sp.]MCF8487700.1 hypothetical protein [Rhodospirillum sp.]MCF8499596.1 hypothetical protein [Rhodospirillum sp.]